LSLRALTYFDDAEREPMPDMLVPFDWEEGEALLRWSGAPARGRDEL